MSYGYGKSEDQLLELIIQDCPDFEGAEKFPKQGTDLNKHYAPVLSTYDRHMLNAI